MPSAVAGPEIERLIQLLARLPGLGPRSARRAALHLIKKREALMAPLTSALETAMEKIEVCKTCGNIDTQNPCTVCTDQRRDPAIINGSRRRRIAMGSGTTVPEVNRLLKQFMEMRKALHGLAEMERSGKPPRGFQMPFFR